MDEACTAEDYRKNHARLSPPHLSAEMPFRSDGDKLEEWLCLRDELKNLQKGITTLLEASHDHLLITPPSHFMPQKVKGFVVG